jgi:hypothetical protein
MIRFRSALKAIICALLCACAFAAAQSPGRFVLREDLATAKAIRNEVARSRKIPFNKRYDELTPEQKALLLSMYDSTDPGDEPPFPVDGIGPPTRAIVKAQSKLLVTGELDLIVDVSAEGEATSVRAIGSPSPEMTRFAASVLLLTRFKPARCAGVPCAQEYPFYLEFSVK